MRNNWLVQESGYLVLCVGCGCFMRELHDKDMVLNKSSMYCDFTVEHTSSTYRAKSLTLLVSACFSRSCVTTSARKAVNPLMFLEFEKFLRIGIW